MVKGLKNESLKGRNFALTIILGIFISIMVITLANLIVSYVYEAPKYENYCNTSNYYAYPDKPYLPQSNNVSCSFNSTLNNQVDACTAKGGNPVYQYNDVGCTVALKNCDMCAKNLENDTNTYNRISFFIFAVIGFVLIVIGLFVTPLLVQLILLPAGAILVIEAAIRNFDDKLAVIIVLALLVVGAVFLALRKLK